MGFFLCLKLDKASGKRGHCSLGFGKVSTGASHREIIPTELVDGSIGLGGTSTDSVDSPMGLDMMQARAIGL